MNHRTSITLTLLAAAMLASSPSLIAQPVEVRHATAELLSDVESIQPGKPFTVGLHLVMEEGWHTYWKNPGDAGMATSITWDLPEGFTAGEIEWPAPHLFGEAPEISYGYDGAMLLPVTITPPATLVPGTPVTLRAVGSWLLCADVCISDKATLTLTLPVTTTAAGPSRWSDLFQTIRDHLPQPATTLTASARKVTDGYRLRLTSSDGTPIPPSLYFYVGEESVIDHSAEQVIERDGEAVLLTLRGSAYAEVPATRLHGVLVMEAEGREKACLIDVPIDDGAQSQR